MNIIIFWYQEYVTEEYYNFKKYVKMEGTLAQFNLFYAEVSYNPIGKGITFVQKHSCAFDWEEVYILILKR